MTKRIRWMQLTVAAAIVAAGVSVSAFAQHTQAVAGAQQVAARTGPTAAQVAALLDRWQEYAASTGMSVDVWRDVMAIQLRQADATTIHALQALEPLLDPNGGASRYEQFVATLGRDVASRVRRMKPQVLGDASSDLVFIPITPCRVVDTRNVGGNIGPFGTRNFYFYSVPAAGTGSPTRAASSARRRRPAREPSFRRELRRRRWRR